MLNLSRLSSTGKQQLQEEEEWEEEIEEVEEEESELEQLTKKELLEKLEAKWPELLRSKNINEDAINRNFSRHFHGFSYYFPEGIIEFVHKDVLTRAQIRWLRAKKSFDELCLHINRILENIIQFNEFLGKIEPFLD